MKKLQKNFKSSYNTVEVFAACDCGCGSQCSCAYCAATWKYRERSRYFKNGYQGNCRTRNYIVTSFINKYPEIIQLSEFDLSQTNISLSRNASEMTDMFAIVGMISLVMMKFLILDLTNQDAYKIFLSR